MPNRDPEFDGLVKELGKRRVIPHGCIFIDIPFGMYLKAFSSLFSREKRNNVHKGLDHEWRKRFHTADTDHVLAALSCRTILDLWLQVMDFPPKSQVLLSAVNIPDMITVLESHDLVCIPIDIDMDTLSCDMQLLEENINERTVAILSAQIYGKANSIDEIIKLAKKYNLCVVEDLAEAYQGEGHTGHVDADLSFYSFGTIKFSTSFGGGVARVRDRRAYEEMKQIEHEYPIVASSAYLKKLIKILPIWLVTNNKVLAEIFLRTTDAFQFDHQKAIISMIRGFPKDELLKNLRQRPSVPLLLTIKERIKTFNTNRHRAFTQRAQRFVDSLPESIKTPGSKAERKGFWLFPVVVDDPNYLGRALNACGVDATLSSTQLRVLPLPDQEDLMEGQQLTEPVRAKEFMSKTLYIPVTKTTSFRDLKYISKAMRKATEWVKQRGKLTGQLKSKL